MNMDGLAALGYDAYVKQAGGRSMVTGDPLPTWERLPEPIRECWRAAAQAVAEGVTGAALT